MADIGKLDIATMAGEGSRAGYSSLDQFNTPTMETPPGRKTGVNESTEALMKTIDLLHEQIDTLNKLLDPVMKRDVVVRSISNSAIPNEKADGPKKSNLAMLIDALNRKLDASSDILNSIIERLDI